MELILNFFYGLNNFLWSYVLIIMLVGLGLYFTARTGFVQFRMLKDMFLLLGEGAVKGKEGHNGISSFQAFCISTASRVGTGNLAGVAIAISIGGPGAVFWMWVMAIIGASSSFIESTLAQIYKEKEGDHFRGGPAYYMEKALGQKWMGVLFSIIISIVFGLIFNSVQANTITLAFEKAFSIDRTILGVILSVMTAVIIFGGVKRIAQFVEYIVPIMAVAYVIVALIVIVKNFNHIPAVFSQIISGAFGFNQAVGGGIGAVIMQGVKRGLFSNEAGSGSAPCAAAAAEVEHPAKQGLIQALGVLVDTVVICSATAFVILLSKGHVQEGLGGMTLLQEAFRYHVGEWGVVFTAVILFLFSFSTILGISFYAKPNLYFLCEKEWPQEAFKIFTLIMLYWGGVRQNFLVWSLADLGLGLMTIVNMIGVFPLVSKALENLKEYEVKFFNK